MRIESLKQGFIPFFFALALLMAFAPAPIYPQIGPGPWTVEVIVDNVVYHHHPFPDGPQRETPKVVQGGTFIIRCKSAWTEPEYDGAYTVTLSWANYDNKPDENFTFLMAEAYFTSGAYSGQQTQADVTLASAPSGSDTMWALSVKRPADNKDPRDGDFNVDITMSASGAGGVPHIPTDNATISIGLVLVESAMESTTVDPITIEVLPRAVDIGLADAPWPKFRRDEQNTGRSPYVGARVNALKWSCAVGCGGLAWVAPSPAVGADGTIYMGSDDNRLYALNPDGTLKWSYATGSQIYSSPAIGANGAIYITGDGMLGMLYALDENGALRWTFDSVWGHSSPTIGPDGTVYVGSYESYQSSLSALHENGDLRWSFSTGLYDRYPTHSCPAIGRDGTIYFTVFDFVEFPIDWALGYGPVGYLFALDENGALKWFRWAGGTSPAVGADGTIYVASGRELLALNPDNTLKWSYVIGLACSSPAIGADNTIFVGGGENLHALNPDGTLKWSYETGGIVGSSPAVGDGTVYVGSGDGKLYAFFENGTLMWIYETGGEVYSSPAIGAGGMTYVGSNDGKLYAIGQRAKFDLVTLYEIGLDLHLWLENGSKLVVKFYSYMGDNQGDNLVWENVTPAHVVLLENIPHPLGKAVEKTELVLTDAEGATISTISTFIVRKIDLEIRFSEIPLEWLSAQTQQEKTALEIEFSEVPLYWLLAPD